MGKQNHDKYVKDLLRDIVGSRFISMGDDVKVAYDGTISASIDGVIENCCAIEVESRVPKQIRGALLDLLEHRLSNKMLILVPVHMNNPKATVGHCQFILNKFGKPGMKYKVILLSGTGNNTRWDEDKNLIEKTLREIGCL